MLWRETSSLLAFDLVFGPVLFLARTVAVPVEASAPDTAVTKRSYTHLVIPQPPHFLNTALGFPHHEHRYSSTLLVLIFGCVQPRACGCGAASSPSSRRTCSSHAASSSSASEDESGRGGAPSARASPTGLLST